VRKRLNQWGKEQKIEEQVGQIFSGLAGQCQEQNQQVPGYQKACRSYFSI
jgi:hypothetical protein